jgi:DNA polymerase elongation subunit (family B)
MVHVRDDRQGDISFKHKSIAYRKKRGGKYTSIYGDQLEKIYQFHRLDTGLFQSDVPVETECLVDLYGDSDEVSTGHCITILDIEVDSTQGYPNVENPKQAITAIAVYENVAKRYYCYVLDEDNLVVSRTEKDRTIEAFQSEEDLLSAFLNKWEEISPTIVTGWNLDGFDLPYLHARLLHLFDEHMAGRLSPLGICYFNKFKNKLTIAGINCLDYLLLYRRYSGKNLPNYRLDSIGIEELKIGKIEYEGSLDNLKKTDINKFIEYNLHDVVLVEKLDAELHFIELAMSICHVCHVGYEEFHVSSKFLEGALLTYLHRKNLIAPNKVFEKDDGGADWEDSSEVGFEGAYVKDPIPGRYEWVCSADIQSLYPSVIMSLNISPETKLGIIPDWSTEKFVKKSSDIIVFADEQYTYEEFGKQLVESNLAVSANGVVYDQAKSGCIPDILKKWFAERLEYKAKMKEASDGGDKAGEVFWKRRQHVQKILLNSIYGCLGLPGWRLFDKDNAEAVTLTGQEIIKTSEKYVNGKMNKRCGTENKDCILAVDTDSLYIHLAPLIALEKPSDPKAFTIATIREIADELNKLYGVMLPRMFNSTLNRIVIAPDVVASAAIWTSKKHYAMLKVYNMELTKDIDDLDVKGLDAVRSSYPKKFRDFMKSILMDILRETTKDKLDKTILDFKASMKDFNIEDVAKNTSVRFTSRTEEKTNFDPKGREPFHFIGGSTAQCKAALAYNDMLKKFSCKETEPIFSGGKIKWVYLKENPFGLDGLAFKDDGKDPKVIMDFINLYADRPRIWEAELQSKLEDFYSALGWQLFSEDQTAINDFFSF